MPDTPLSASTRLIYPIVKQFYEVGSIIPIFQMMKHRLGVGNLPEVTCSY